ncbi:hypothetical protein [Tautonia plasticadhaerens]|uniref:Uncharacterized protein n=1 Tax=Tautonia plasticadhaerens TaxID=2527974 RepID=A0A518HCG5_9BACT|nr:hypothetical protein [Tautonia plasticadhaerens]QDV38346.1 hypothetical protein ElP_62980 [Tautonia plasticadhaerens]
MAITSFDGFVGLAAEGAGHGDVLDGEGRAGQSTGDEFGRLVRLVRENERLLAELDRVRGQCRRAWAYLGEPGCNAALAMAQLERARLRRSAVLAHLRANRVEARALLGRPPAGVDQIELN